MTVPDTLAIGFGYLSKRDAHYDMPVKCYICDTPHEKTPNVAKLRRSTP